MLRTLCLLLLLSGSLYGQTPADSTLKSPMFLAYTPPQRTTADTVRALHQLFRGRRAIGGMLFVVGGAALLIAPFASVSSGPPATSYGHLSEFAGGVGVGLAISVPLFTLGGIQFAHNSRRDEEQAIALYLEKRSLPNKLRKKLKPELFQPPNMLAPHR